MQLLLEETKSIEIKELEDCLKENRLKQEMLDELGYIDDDEIKLKHARHLDKINNISTMPSELSTILEAEQPDFSYEPTTQNSLRRILEQYKKEKPETSWELHMPGQNFTGPGTRIVQRITDHVLPNNKTDAATLMHDVDYMIATSNNQSIKADYDAIKRADWKTLQGLLTTTGLVMRSQNLPNMFYGGNEVIGHVLKHYVKNEPIYQETFKQFGLDKELKDW